MRASVIVAFAAIIAASALAQPAPDDVMLFARAFSQKYSLSARDVMEAVIDVLDRCGLLDEPSSIGGGLKRQDRSANNGESFLTGPSILDSPSNIEANNRGQRRFAIGRTRGNAHSGNRQSPASGQRTPESSDSSDSDSSDGSPDEAARRPGQAQTPRPGAWVRLGAGWRPGTSSAQRGQGPASGQRNTANNRGSGGASGNTSNRNTGGPFNVNVGNDNRVYRQVGNSVRVGPGANDLSINNRAGAPSSGGQRQPGRQCFLLTWTKSDDGEVVTTG